MQLDESVEMQRGYFRSVFRLITKISLLEFFRVDASFVFNFVWLNRKANTENAAKLTHVLIHLRS